MARRYSPRVALSGPVTIRSYCGNTDARATLKLFQCAALETARADYEEAQVAAWAGVGFRELRVWDEARAAAHTFVAEAEARVVGFADFTDDAILDMLFVDPRVSRRGIARQLVGHVQAAAREAGLSFLSTYASRTARPALERLGFSTLAYRPDNEVRGVVVPNYEMRCDLSAIQ